jgi:hypothetical protein
MLLFIVFWNFMIKVLYQGNDFCGDGPDQINVWDGEAWGSHNGQGILILFSRKWSVAWYILETILSSDIFS